MPSSLVDDILCNARRAGIAMTRSRAEQIAVAVAPRLSAFATIGQHLSFDAAPSFEAELLAARQLPEQSQ
jgi:hypothetical protein